MTVMLDAGAVVRRFARDLDATVRREKRVAMTSPLYDLPGRSSVGFAAVHDVAPELVTRLDAVTTPEEVGRRMAAPLMRPYLLQLFILIEGYLMEREQRILDDGPEAVEGDAAATERVVSWVARTCAAYRADDELFPGADVTTHPILDPTEVEQLLDARGLAEDEAARVKRAFGSLELYALTLHGEQRDGHFDHGPYPLGGGTWAAVHEVNDLNNDLLPWSDVDVRLPIDAVGAVRVYADEVVPTFEMFGTMATRPAAAPYEIRGLWAREGDRLRPLAVDELEAVAAQAARATTLLFERIAAWDADYRIAYGAPLFVNHLVPFARIAGVPELESWLLERAVAVAEARLPELRSGEPRSIWAHLARGGEDMFHPLEGRS